jgi:carboxymethylenebutenolidase
MTGRRDRVMVADGSFAAHVVVPDQPSGAGIVLIQEIFGVGAYIISVADRLADLGYTVAAPDLFWRFAPGHAADHDEAGLGQSIELVGQLDPELAVADCLATLAHLRSLPEVTGSVGVLGFCLGGTLAVGCALAGSPDAVVSYYGSGVPGMVDQLGQVTAPTLLHFGGADPYIPTDQLDAVVAAAPKHPTIELNVEAGAGHAFDNHEAPMFHDADAAAHAWELTRKFLASHLPTGGAD